VPADFLSRIRSLHRRLGIPADYAARRQLPLHREARRLVSVGPAADDGKPVRLTPSAARAWKRMQAAAAREDVALLPLSGFRSIARQAKIIRRKRAAGWSVDEILRLVAAPGHSEHHTGRALDLGVAGHVGLDEDFARTPAYRWLRQHASAYGFRLSYPRKNVHGIGFEPWHWCWIG
jgi:D-alanyl-D-alanine carboxypeptidase